MNVLLFSRSLKLVGVVLMLCAYLYLETLSFPLALGLSWAGISLIMTALFTGSKNVDISRPQVSKSQKARSGRGYQAEA